jgi:hypothetical protein
MLKFVLNEWTLLLTPNSFSGTENFVLDVSNIDVVWAGQNQDVLQVKTTARVSLQSRVSLNGIG